MKSRLTRAITASLLLLGSTVVPGCTYIVWGEGGKWPVERDEYVQIEAAAVAEKDVLFLKVMRKHSGTETWRIEFQRPQSASDDWHFRQPETVRDDDFPSSSILEVYVLSKEEIEAHDVSRIRGKAPLLVGLDGFHLADIVHPDLTLIDSRWPDHSLRIDLPDPPIAWNTASTLGHVLVTPLTLSLDVVFFPVWGLILVVRFLSLDG